MVFQETCLHLMGPAAPGTPSPVMILERLAVDLGHRGAGGGAASLKDALLRPAQAADLAGIRANKGTHLRI